MVLKVKVENMTSSTGNPVPNQFRIWTKEGEYFQSYNSIIAFRPFGLGNAKIQLGKDWAYSVTTGKYRNQFLEETKQETKAKLDSGEYILNPEL